MMDIVCLAGCLTMLMIFYAIYMCKMIQQRKQGITTNQLGKNAESKQRKTVIVERVLGTVSWLIVVVQLISIVCKWSMLPTGFRIFGIVLGLVGDSIFGSAVYTMRDSWRAGIPKENTKMVTTGIYGYSRNPAFLGFYLLYIGVLLVYANPLLLVMTIVTMITFHLQVLEEEKHLVGAFGDDYKEYRGRVRRYLGKKDA